MIFGMVFYALETFHNWNKFIQEGLVNFSIDTNLEHNNTAQSTDTKPFLYLTGTEQCLPANLASSNQIGDTKTCACDVMVLSFRTKCETPQGNQSHISYLFDPNTGWASARNVLFFYRNENKTSLPLLHIRKRRHSSQVQPVYSCQHARGVTVSSCGKVAVRLRASRGSVGLYGSQWSKCCA